MDILLHQACRHSGTDFGRISDDHCFAPAWSRAQHGASAPPPPAVRLCSHADGLHEVRDAVNEIIHALVDYNLLCVHDDDGVADQADSEDAEDEVEGGD